MPRAWLVSLFVLLAASASAEPIPISDITGGWEQPNPTQGVTIVNSSGTDVIAWGVPNVDQQSRYSFAPHSDLMVQVDSPFQVGEFSHQNSVVTDPVLTSVDYAFSLRAGGVPVTTVFHFTHDETVNVLPCLARNSVSICDDFVTVANASLSVPLIVDGRPLYFRLAGFSTNGGQSTTEVFQSPEGSTNRAGLYAIVSSRAPSPIPEPSTLGLVGCVLVGRAVARWRSRRPATRRSSESRFK